MVVISSHRCYRLRSTENGLTARAITWSEGNDDIESGFCWPRRLPMANDGNTVMVIYVPFPIPPADLDTRRNDILPSRIRLPSKAATLGKSHMAAELAGVKPNRAFVCNGMTKPSSPSNKIPRPSIGKRLVSAEQNRLRRALQSRVQAGEALQVAGGPARPRHRACRTAGRGQAFGTPARARTQRIAADGCVPGPSSCRRRKRPCC